MTEDEIVGWYHWLNGHEFEQAPGVGDGQGSLVCCSPWGCKELDTTERLKWTECQWGLREAVTFIHLWLEYKFVWIFLEQLGNIFKAKI